MNKCQRCGATGCDIRTLFMACLYDMSELQIPFDKVTINGSYWFHSSAAIFCPEIYSFNQNLFTLKVCKDCRSDWLDQIGKWFDKKPTPPGGSVE